MPAPASAGQAEAARLSLPPQKDGRKAFGWQLGKDNQALGLDSGGALDSTDPEAWHDAAGYISTKFTGLEAARFRRLARHIEIKVAVNMLVKGGDAEHRVLVIDRPVCGRRVPRPNGSCDELLDRLLANTSHRLTVVEMDGSQVTYPRKDRRR